MIYRPSDSGQDLSILHIILSYGYLYTVSIFIFAHVNSFSTPDIETNIWSMIDTALFQ